MITFKDIWDRQIEQQQKLGINHEIMTDEERHKLLSDLVLGLFEEATELKNELIPKHHQLKSGPIVQSNAIDQCVDLLKYTMSVAIAIGCTPEEFLQSFFEKSNLVDQRWAAELMELKESTKVVITDLDGVVADWFVQIDVFCQAKVKKHFRDLTQADREWLAVEFYKEGGFRDTPLVPGAAKALELILENGFKLVVITSRPYHKVRRIATDTHHWLVKHGIKPHMVLWSKDKSEAVWDHVHPANIVAFIEDDPKHALDLSEDGIRVLYFQSMISEELSESDNLVSVMNWMEVLDDLGIETGNPLSKLSVRKYMQKGGKR